MKNSRRIGALVAMATTAVGVASMMAGAPASAAARGPEPVSNWLRPVRAFTNNWVDIYWRTDRPVCDVQVRVAGRGVGVGYPGHRRFTSLNRGTMLRPGRTDYTSVQVSPVFDRPGAVLLRAAITYDNCRFHARSQSRVFTLTLPVLRHDRPGHDFPGNGGPGNGGWPGNGGPGNGGPGNGGWPGNGGPGNGGWPGNGGPGNGGHDNGGPGGNHGGPGGNHGGPGGNHGGPGDNHGGPGGQPHQWPTTQPTPTSTATTTAPPAGNNGTPSTTMPTTTAPATTTTATPPTTAPTTGTPTTTASSGDGTDHGHHNPGGGGDNGGHGMGGHDGGGHGPGGNGQG